MFVVCMQRQDFSIRGSLQDSVSRAIDLVSVYLPLFTSLAFVLPSVAMVLSYFNSCKLEFARSGAESRARDDAQSFEGIPESILDDAADCLHQKFNGILPDMIKEVQSQSSKDRFNVERCLDVFVDDPEFDTLMELASVGADVPIDSAFVLQSQPEPLRSLHTRLGNCIPQHVVVLTLSVGCCQFVILGILQFG